MKSVRSAAIIVALSTLATFGLAAPALADDPPPTDPPVTTPSDPPATDPAPSDTPAPAPSPTETPDADGQYSPPSWWPANGGTYYPGAPLPILPHNGFIPCGSNVIGPPGYEGADGYWYNQNPSGNNDGYCSPPFQMTHIFWVNGGFYLQDPLVVGFGAAESSRVDNNWKGSDSNTALRDNGGYVPAPLGATGHTVNGVFTYDTTSVSAFASSAPRAVNSAPIGHAELPWTMGDPSLQPVNSPSGTTW